MNNLEQILKELYEIDPALKRYETEVRNTVSEILKVKPDTKFDASVAADLKRRLMLAEAGESADYRVRKSTEQQAPKFHKSIINFNLMNQYQRILAGVLAAVILIFIGYRLPHKSQQDAVPVRDIGSALNTKKQTEVKKFTSKEDFSTYLEQAQNLGYGMGGGVDSGLGSERNMALDMPTGLGQPSAGLKQAAPFAPSRVSETNVQVKGIDEPDIAKTNGKEIFVSTPQFYVLDRFSPVESVPAVGRESEIWPPSPSDRSGETRVIDALPADRIRQIGKIPRQGEMLLSGDNLIIFENNYVYGFDVKKPDEPEEKWKVRLENGQLITARLVDNKIYLVTQSDIDYLNPCPIRPLYIEGKSLEVLCADIYHPIVPVSDSTTYHAFRINPASGEIEKTLSFVGSAGQSVVYVSKDNLYIAYVYNEDQVKILADFLKSGGRGLFPSSVISKIDKLLAYDIGVSAKQAELNEILRKHYASLNQDDRRKLENEVENKLSDYVKAHARDFVFTGLVKITLENFAIQATGRVPGVPLNQFALDEFKDNLRIAVTISGQGTIWGGWRSDSSANDVYVLDKDLDVIGSITNLGLTERIYSARFVNERGFLVTFRQTDPFYVLDLSNPRAPRMAGELKIPGFSSYLHPLKENLILGVGQENGRVKLSLFDVSNSASPQEVDKYTLDEYWSEAQNNHHAFLQDEKYEVFFLPGGSTGYVFGYEGNRLNLKKAVGQIQAQRALYINDALFVIGSDKIVALDENSWERVGELVYP